MAKARFILLAGFVAATVLFGADNKMARPDNYREWIWLTSGLGMSYSRTTPASDPDFDNVFVSPAAYRAFVRTGTWPNGTVLVLEIRASRGNASINRSGHFQGELDAIEVHAKDTRIPGNWAFYGFGKDKKEATMIPRTANCYSCHEQNGVVDTTFVQFYPTLFKIAQQKNTVRTSAVANESPAN
jgi:hypothetical protein